MTPTQWLAMAPLPPGKYVDPFVTLSTDARSDLSNRLTGPDVEIAAAAHVEFFGIMLASGGLKNSYGGHTAESHSFGWAPEPIMTRCAELLRVIGWDAKVDLHCDYGMDYGPSCGVVVNLP